MHKKSSTWIFKNYRKGVSMLYLAENLKKYRIIKGLTQEDVAEYLNITPQSVSKWERSETYPDITLLPALANIFETSIDLLIGMDVARADTTKHNIHQSASDFMRDGNYDSAEKIYRDALLIYPNNASMILGLAEALALNNKAEEAIKFIEMGLPLSNNEKHKATIRATLCFLYQKCGQIKKAQQLASELPHTRESREVIELMIAKNLTVNEIDKQINFILLGE